MLVRVIQKCFVNNVLREAGVEFEYDGEINPNVMISLEDEAPVNKPVAKVAKKAAKKTEKIATKKD